MSFLTIVAVLIIGLVMLVIGYFTKKSWIKILSLIPIVISMIQIIQLLNM
ncbi:hypothetical protein [Bacillus sp. LL01]|nr:hypothetical protein [Bacillus sp. LL01]